MLRAYDSVERRIKTKQNLLIARIEEARQKGETVSVTWLLEQERYHQLLEQLSKEAAELADSATAKLNSVQQGVVVASADVAEQMTYRAAGVTNAEAAKSVGIIFNRLPQAELLAAVGMTADGSPISALFQDLVSDRAEDLRQTLLAGIGSGASSKQIAKELETVASISRARAATIARTELHRAQRTGSLESYRASSAVEGWYWVAACDKRTCPVCWAMHGTWHSLDEAMGSHPSCRCYMSPALKDFRKSPDQKDVRPKPVPGEDRFAKLSDADQREILGPDRYELWKSGKVSLSDFVHTEHDPKWGTVRRARTVEKAIQQGTARSARTGSLQLGGMASGNDRLNLGDRSMLKPVDWAEDFFSIGRTLTSAERHIRNKTLAEGECFVAFDQKGRKLFSLYAQDTQVRIPQEQLEKCKGVVLTHNHPLLKTMFSSPANGDKLVSTSLSAADITTACRAEMAEIRAVTKTQTYSVKPPAAGWGKQFYDDVLGPAINRSEVQLMKDFNRLIEEGVDFPAGDEDELQHEFIKRIADETGIIYRRSKAK